MFSQRLANDRITRAENLRDEKTYDASNVSSQDDLDPSRTVQAAEGPFERIEATDVKAHAECDDEREDKIRQQAKAVATSFTVGSGGSGGVFAPAIVCGGALGGAVGIFFARVLPASWGVHPAAFALVGMAGFLASAIRTPLTAIVMVAEISGNHQLIVPAMWVCGISFWLNNGWSLYRSQVHNRESSPVHA